MRRRHLGRGLHRPVETGQRLGTPAEPAQRLPQQPVRTRLPRIAGPCGLVIFGVTGDLSRKKLMPAVYDLANRGLLPPGFALVGFARTPGADFRLQESWSWSSFYGAHFALDRLEA